MSIIKAMLGYRNFFHTLVTDTVLELDDLMDQVHRKNLVRNIPDAFDTYAKFSISAKRLQQCEVTEVISNTKGMYIELNT